MGNKKTNVSKIEVEKLFGFYNYTLPNNINSDISKLMIVYGDNGSGKTTILKLFFYLLSTRDRSGYKTRIAEIKFQRFAVIFQNGIEIGAKRDRASIGTYEYYIAKNGKTQKSLILKASSDNNIRIEQQGSKDEHTFCIQSKAGSSMQGRNYVTEYYEYDSKADAEGNVTVKGLE